MFTQLPSKANLAFCVENPGQISVDRCFLFFWVFFNYQLIYWLSALYFSLMWTFQVSSGTVCTRTLMNLSFWKSQANILTPRWRKTPYSASVPQFHHLAHKVLVVWASTLECPDRNMWAMWGQLESWNAAPSCRHWESSRTRAVGYWDLEFKKEVRAKESDSGCGPKSRSNHPGESVAWEEKTRLSLLQWFRASEDPSQSMVVGTEGKLWRYSQYSVLSASLGLEKKDQDNSPFPGPPLAKQVAPHLCSLWVSLWQTPQCIVIVCVYVLHFPHFHHPRAYWLPSRS